jgi:hypothetical protein
VVDGVRHAPVLRLGGVVVVNVPGRGVNLHVLKQGRRALLRKRGERRASLTRGSDLGGVGEELL